MSSIASTSAPPCLRWRADLNGDGCLDDTDGDTVTDDLDLCPAVDASGFDLDLDGCLDDTDGDTVTDDLDLCPAVDASGFDLDLDGCLDDTDGDTVTDDLDLCPAAGRHPQHRQRRRRRLPRPLPRRVFAGGRPQRRRLPR